MKYDYTFTFRDKKAEGSVIIPDHRDATPDQIQKTIHEDAYQNALTIYRDLKEEEVKINFVFNVNTGK